MANRVDVRVAIDSIDEFMKNYVPKQYGVLTELYKKVVTEAYQYNLDSINKMLYECIASVDEELLKTYGQMCDDRLCTSKLLDFVTNTENIHLKDLVKNELGRKEQDWLELLPDFVKESDAEILSPNTEHAPWLRLPFLDEIERTISDARGTYQEIYKKYQNLEAGLYSDNEAVLGLDVYVNISKEEEEWIFEYMLIDILKELFGKYLIMAQNEVSRITEVACVGTGEFDYNDIKEEVLGFIGLLISELSNLYREVIGILAAACDDKPWWTLYDYAQEWTNGIKQGLEAKFKTNWEKLFEEEKKGFYAFAENTNQCDYAKDIAKELEKKVLNYPNDYFNLDVNVLNPLKEEGKYDPVAMTNLIAEIQKREVQYDELMKKYYFLAQDKTRNNACLAPLVPMVTALKNLDISNLRIYLEILKDLEEQKLDNEKKK